MDPDKNPQLAREAGIRNFGTAVVQVGAKKEEAKSMTEEGITGAFIRDLKSHHEDGVFRHRQRRASRETSSDREGLSRFKDLLAKDSYENKTVDLLQCGGCTRRLHRAGNRGADQKLRAAGSRCHQEVRGGRRPGAV